MSVDADRARTDPRHPQSEPEPGRPRETARPIFVSGPDRSGTTLIYALLASHPDLSMVRRTNMWRYFDGRYGDLADPANLDRCLDDMIAFRRMRHLNPDRERIRREFLDGPATYGRLFALFHDHHAERADRPRWGDKSLHTEHFADRVFAEFPDARIVHMMRDPRDRYASVRKRWGRDEPRLANATGRWLASTRAARRHALADPDRFLIVRYEDLARTPEDTMHLVCAFADLRYTSEMLAMEGAPEHRERGGNSSYGPRQPGTISTMSIGRFAEVLSPTEIAYIDRTARDEMDAFDYPPAGVSLSPAARARLVAWTMPAASVRMRAGMALEERTRRRGEAVPTGKRDGVSGSSDVDDGRTVT